MSNTFNYTFEDLPLVITNGIEAALVDGQAEIEYYRGGEFDILNITLEGFGGRDINGKRQWPQVEIPTPIVNIIRHRLENQWHDRICEAVREQLASDREAALEERADARREERMLERE